MFFFHTRRFLFLNVHNLYINSITAKCFELFTYTMSNSYIAVIAIPVKFGLLPFATTTVTSLCGSHEQWKLCGHAVRIQAFNREVGSSRLKLVALFVSLGKSLYLHCFSLPSCINGYRQTAGNNLRWTSSVPCRGSITLIRFILQKLYKLQPYEP